MRGTILVVDDDADAAEMLCESLRLRGFRATPESDPAQALVDALSADIDVILTDLMMRSLDGLALCDRIVGARPDLPVKCSRGTRASMPPSARCAPAPSTSW